MNAKREFRNDLEEIQEAETEARRTHMEYGMGIEVDRTRGGSSAGAKTEKNSDIAESSSAHASHEMLTRIV